VSEVNEPGPERPLERETLRRVSEVNEPGPERPFERAEPGLF